MFTALLPVFTVVAIRRAVGVTGWKAERGLFPSSCEVDRMNNENTCEAGTANFGGSIPSEHITLSSIEGGSLGTASQS